MANKLMQGLVKRVEERCRRLLGRRAGVAMIVALAAPMLIAITGLSVDVGFWFQNQTSLQTAADASALAAAMNDARLGQTGATNKATSAAPYAQAVADTSTNSQFNFASYAVNTNPVVEVTVTSVSPNPGYWSVPTVYKTTVHAARPSFLSNVSGLGVAGLPAGTQYAQAKATINSMVEVTGDSCLLANPSDKSQTGIEVDDKGGGTVGGITGANCAITANCPSGTAFAQSGHGTITAAEIIVAGAGCNAPTPDQYIYTTANASTASSTSLNGVVQAPLSQSDPFKNMGDPPTAWEKAALPTCVTSDSKPSNDETVTISPPTGYTYCSYGSYKLPTQGTVNFAAGSYFFSNGFSLNGGTSVNFGAGIYYFGGSSSLSLTGGATYAGSNITFIFEDTASYNIAGNSSTLNLSAPNTNCVAPTSYPVAAYTLTAPYDGTNNKGICGILIYQARSDTSGDSMTGNTGSTVTGIIYAPGAQLTFNGNGGLSASKDASGNLNTLAVMVNSLLATGNGNLTLSLGSDYAGTTLQQTTTTVVSVSAPLLTN